MKKNYLKNEKSYYLQQHASNPINWFPWGEKAIEKAKKENKIIILSIGYSSCHWCTVMEGEAFSCPIISRFFVLFLFRKVTNSKSSASIH